MLTRLDTAAFTRLFDAWLRQQPGSLLQALALDGKMIRERSGLLTLVQHEDDRLCSVAVYDQKKHAALRTDHRYRASMGPRR